mgnify:CR=1 FL=1
MRVRFLRFHSIYFIFMIMCYEGENGMSVAVLVIAHGSPDPDWRRLVEQSIASCRERLPWPVRIAYLGDRHEGSLAEQMAKLEKEGCETVVAVPLFVSGGSTHIGEIRQLLGLAPEYPLPQAVAPRPSKMRIVWCPPLEDHPLVEQIVEDRLLALSTAARRETLLLVGHGSDLAGYREHWERLLQRLAATIQRRFPLASVGYATLRPDTVTARARQLAASGTLLVLPLFISPGYFTRRAIPRRLDGIPHRYRGEAYVPHPAIGQWIVRSAQDALRSHGAS